ncbi:hypothetical protein [Kitasatospora sp. NPDC127116]|uniref:hypothetical protein n=1 Tax=Kitasatospora sp. NPDC127116 TaxID=3345367 RepID=UPI003632C82B
MVSTPCQAQGPLTWHSEKDHSQGAVTTRSTYDAVLSIFGAVWFTDPERLLLTAGFTDPDVRVLDAPEPGHIGTLIARAVVA